MDITISINTDNDAMDNGSDRAIADVLKKLADRIVINGIGSITKVMDLNGNSIGSVDVTL